MPTYTTFPCTVTYRGFIDGDQSLADEAHKFLQEGYFYGPLGNTMLFALTNVFGLPIIVFSLAHHYLLIKMSPRVCKATILLYVTFNQCGAGHYDPIVFKNKALNLHTTKFTPDKSCTCGRGSKHSSTWEHCGVLKYKYTTSIHCPCHLSGRGCTPLCHCRNCVNPHGVKPR